MHNGDRLTPFFDFFFWDPFVMALYALAWYVEPLLYMIRPYECLEVSTVWRCIPTKGTVQLQLCMDRLFVSSLITFL